MSPHKKQTKYQTNADEDNSTGEQNMVVVKKHRVRNQQNDGAGTMHSGGTSEVVQDVNDVQDYVGTSDSPAHERGEQATSSNKVDHSDAPMHNDSPGNGVSGDQVADGAVGGADEVNGGGDSSGVVQCLGQSTSWQDNTATSKSEKDPWYKPTVSLPCVSHWVVIHICNRHN